MKIIIYISLLIAGILLGWLLFGRGEREAPEQAEISAGEVSEWTCSMHPQVRQDEPGDCPICGMELIPVSQQGGQQQDDPYLLTLAESQARWANVQTKIVGQTGSGAELRLTGRVAVNETESKVITATFAGRIERLFADYTGMNIQRGERLATLYSPEMMQAQQELIQAYAMREEQPRLYESARRRLGLLNLTEAQINRIESTQQASPTLDIYATQSGFLTQREVSQGDYVERGQVLFTISSLKDIWVELDAYENQLGMISTGMQAAVSVPSHPGEQLTGKVEFIDPFLNPETRTARVRLTVDNKENLLKPGMLVTATMTGTTGGELVIPSTAVLWTGTSSVVYVKVPQEQGVTFEYREIEIGARTAEGVQVLSGLNAGEEIAVNGVFAIDAAAQLRGGYSMMAPPAPATTLPTDFSQKLERLFNIYFDIKNALANDSAEDALTHGKELSQQLENVGSHSLEGEHHTFWMEQYLLIEEHIKEFNNADDLVQLRAQFEFLSQPFIETARTLGAIGKTWYVSFCPMFDNDRGAYWLSESEEILNPYFGSMMLTCGEVRETIRPGVSAKEQPQQRREAEHVH